TLIAEHKFRLGLEELGKNRVGRESAVQPIEPPDVTELAAGSRHEVSKRKRFGAEIDRAAVFAHDAPMCLVYNAIVIGQHFRSRSLSGIVGDEQIHALAIPSIALPDLQIGVCKGR